MLCYGSRGTSRLSSFCIDRKLFCRIFITLICRVFVVWIFRLVDLRHISGIVHCRNGKILIPRIKLLQADIQSSVCKVCKFISVDIDCFRSGIRIMYLYTQKSVTDRSIKRRLCGVKTFDCTASLIGMILLVSDLHIHRTVFRNLQLSVLCHIRPASILSYLRLNLGNFKISCVCHILNRKCHGCFVIMPPIRLIDLDCDIRLFICTELVIFHAYLAIMVVFIRTTFILTGTLRFFYITTGYRMLFRAVFFRTAFCFLLCIILGSVFLRTTFRLCILRMNTHCIIPVHGKSQSGHTE